jgi:site-specific DNA recombinase
MAQKAAIYVRVSTDSDAQRDSPQHQIATCTEYAVEHGFTVAENCVYNDAGVSGTEMANRPEVQRLLTDARGGAFDAVLFTAISRFSRDLSDAFQMKKSLESIYGIRLISIEEGYDSAIAGRNNEMVFTVHAMLAAHKSKEMSVAIQRGLKQSARRGRHTGNTAPYGYVKGPDKVLRVDVRTADVVRNIFQLYLAGHGTAEIANRLNQERIPTATALRKGYSMLWQASSISSILHNPVYTGTIVAHKWAMGQDVQSSRRANAAVKKAFIRNQEEWVVVERSHEPLIDEETFQQVQTMMRRKAGSRSDRRNTNCLAGLLRCGLCGGAMIVTSSGSKPPGGSNYRYIVCGRARRLGRQGCSNRQRVPYDDVLSFLLRHLSTLFTEYQQTHPEPEGLSHILWREREADRARVKSLQTALHRTELEQRQNLQAYQSGWFEPEVVRQEQMALDQRVRRLRLQLEILQETLAELEHRNADTPLFRKQLNPFLTPYWNTESNLRPLLQMTIEQVVFPGGQEVHVFFRFSVQ